MSDFIENLKKRRTTLVLRFAVSGALYLVFAALCISYGALLLEERNTLIVGLCAAVVAMFILPQRASPGRWPKGRGPEEEFEISSLRVSFRRLDQFCTRLRVGYIIGGVLLVWVFVL